jgi:hypothetical protein
MFRDDRQLAHPDAGARVLLGFASRAEPERTHSESVPRRPYAVT